MHKCFFFGCVDCNAGTITNYKWPGWFILPDILTPAWTPSTWGYEPKWVHTCKCPREIEETVLIWTEGRGSLWETSCIMDTVSPFLQPLPLFFIVNTSVFCREWTVCLWNNWRACYSVPHVCSRGLVFHTWLKIWISPCWYSWGLPEVPWVFIGQSWSPEILCISSSFIWPCTSLLCVH